VADAAYGDAAYRAARDYLRANVVVCAWPGCNARATSPDHVPALADHPHVRGSGCCTFRALCLSHNCSAGASLGNRRRRVATRARRGLAPGSSVFGVRDRLDPAAVVRLSPPPRPDAERK
jgi:hypothetical protein